MATLKDVARLACVDVSTVSRALNNTSYVHPDTKARILAAVKELSYQPNVLAQGLRQGKRHTIGVVVPQIQLTVFSDILQGIESEARLLGYSTLICTTNNDPEVEKQCLNRLRNGFVDGIIIAATGKNGRLLHDIHATGLAVVQLIRQQEKGISSVVADYYSCGYDAVRYLHSLGCRSIGLINGSIDLVPYRNRYRGYCQAMEELSLKKYPALSMDLPENSFEYGYESASYLLDTVEELDSIIVAVDIQGIGAMRALKKRGKRVPEDIRLMSMTGYSIGAMLQTSMTAQEIPAQEIGESVTRVVINEIEAPSGSKPSVQHLVFPASLVQREST